LQGRAWRLAGPSFRSVRVAQKAKLGDWKFWFGRGLAQFATSEIPKWECALGGILTNFFTRSCLLVSSSSFRVQVTEYPFDLPEIYKEIQGS
jgi:hypothetical protein